MDNNAPITEHGQFWLRDNDQKKLWGTLYINEVNEAKLETFGSLIDFSEGGKHTIVGQIRSGQELVTLIDCIATNTRNPWSSQDGQTDWSHQTYLVNGVVKGIAFEEGEEVAFELASISISTLPKWANPNLVTLDSAQGEAGTQWVNLKIVERTDETITVVFGGQEIRISLRFRPKVDVNRGRQGAITRYLVEHDCHLEMERSDGSKMPLESILSVAKGMQDLLGICCNETPTVTSFLVIYEKGKPSPGKVFVRTWGIGTEGKVSRRNPALGLEDFAGMGGVARWLETAEKYGIAVTLLTSNWYNEKAYNEDKFSRMYTAVEGLLAVKNECNTANMKDAELAKFVEDNIPGFSSITNRPSEDWAKNVRDLRNKNIGHLDPTSTVATDGRAMHVMTNVLYTAGASFLLKEMGMGEKQIDKFIKECQGSLLLKE